MDFELNEQQRMIKDTIRKFLEKEISPLIEEYESVRKPLTKDIIRQLEPFGFSRALVPEEMGGLGLDFISYFVMGEELSRVWGSLRTIVTTNGMAPYIIAKEGTKRQRDGWRSGYADQSVCPTGKIGPMDQNHVYDNGKTEGNQHKVRPS